MFWLEAIEKPSKKKENGCCFLLSWSVTLEKHTFRNIIVNNKAYNIHKLLMNTISRTIV